MSRVMKYFTPELLARFRSADDDVADAAAEEWARAQARYERYLEDRREDFTPGTRALPGGPSLHDAAIIKMSEERGLGSSRSIALRLGDGLGDLLVLLYAQASVKMTSSRAPGPADNVRPPRVLYDEIQVTTRRGAADRRYRHNLLCTGDVLIRVTFADVAAALVKASELHPVGPPRAG
ncbi:MAG: hypothetical protein ACRC33_20185 [Gemmataceae bacterium]